MEFWTSMAGKVVGGVVALAVIVAGITWWTLEPATRSQIMGGTGKVLGWLGIVLLVPWATFFLIGQVDRLESNLAGGLLVASYTLLELVLMLWLFGWSVKGAAAWTFVGVGTLFAGVYNLFTCDWIAEKVS